MMMIVAGTAGAFGAAPGDKDRPGPDALPEAASLPDVFAFEGGGRVEAREQWERRRQEILSQLEYYEYGHQPPTPDNLRVEDLSSESVFDGAAMLHRFVLSMGPEQKVKMHGAVYVPAGKAKTYPVLLAIEPVWDDKLRPAAQRAVERGYIFAGYDRHDLDPDDDDRSNGVHPLYPDYDWATLAVWAWGASRVVDYLYTREDVQRAHIALTGHSRGGKTALWAGALDTRITLISPHASGEGGAGCHRIQGEGAESLALITNLKRFHYWFQPRLRDFVGKENRLPFDQHFLKALIAPRPLVSVEGLEDHWANPLGTQHVWMAAQPVYDFLGAPDRNVLHFRPGAHDTTAGDWEALLDYCDHFFFGKALPFAPPAPPFPEEKKAFSWSAPGAPSS